MKYNYGVNFTCTWYDSCSEYVIHEGSKHTCTEYMIEHIIHVQSTQFMHRVCNASIISLEITREIREGNAEGRGRGRTNRQC